MALQNIEPDKLKKILEDHLHWIREDCDGWEDMRANLYGAYLSGANLSGANLSGETLSGANEISFIPLSCPDTGSFIGWKKACVELDIGENTTRLFVIVRLLIPEDAKRSSATSEKCRCDKATVLEIQSLDGSEKYQAAYSGFDRNFIYTVGETVTVPDFDENRWSECSTGIHFFINRQSAVDY